MAKEKLYTVGEFAKICHVTPRTLKYYEERQLLQPAVTGDNGYRYYSLGQIDEMSAILLFRDYGFSLDEISSIMQQNDFEGIALRMKMLLDIIGEQKKKLEIQEKNIRYTAAHIERARRYPEKIFVNAQTINAWFDPVQIRVDNTFIINYLTDGFRSGTCFSATDFTVCGRYREEINQHSEDKKDCEIADIQNERWSKSKVKTQNIQNQTFEEVTQKTENETAQGKTVSELKILNTQKQKIQLSGKCVSLYAFGWPKKEIIAKTVAAAEKENIQPTMIFCEMILENISPDKCLFRYFAQEYMTWETV